MPDKILDALKWFSTLSASEILKAVLALVFFAFGYYVYNAQKYMEAQDARISTLTIRCATNDSISQAALEKCHQERFKDIEENSRYWRERVETMEERSSVNNRNIQEIKRVN